LGVPRDPLRMRLRFPHERNMRDPTARAGAISVLKNLKHSGYAFPPYLLRRWAAANGWKPPDAQLLDDYAAGIHAGVRYHAGDPLGGSIQRWIKDAEGKQPWLDPGRGDLPSRATLTKRN